MNTTYRLQYLLEKGINNILIYVCLINYQINDILDFENKFIRVSQVFLNEMALTYFGVHHL